MRSILMALATLLVCCSLARADGGAVRASETSGPWRITVFTAPTPWRAGLVDVSVLVQELATGDPVPEADVWVRVIPVGRPGVATRYRATGDSATNKLYHAAEFELPEAGRWRVEVRVEQSGVSADVAFEVEAPEPLPPWLQLAWWIGWPIVPILLFGIHQLLVQRGKAAGLQI